jgi:hypothetical protein
VSIKPVGIGLLCYRVVALALHSRITMRRSPTRLGGPARLWCHAHASEFFARGLAVANSFQYH